MIDGPTLMLIIDDLVACDRVCDGSVNNKFVCVPATLSCWSGFGQLQDLGLNMYDTRKKCDRSEDADGPVSPAHSNL